MLDGVNKILEKEEYPSDFPVGMLTTEQRDVWAVTREYLESLGNTEVGNNSFNYTSLVTLVRPCLMIIDRSNTEYHRNVSVVHSFVLIIILNVPLHFEVNYQ